ncbi:MAG: undecaprenyl/decaprenyl-phosphate alpha-N-acetylglucosaminyl 1-phosphate transferase [Tannerellaceae bacterium]|jgi:UDP-N-acetylmuramyl pentapeptide phosphotransferase/UDP-N-acetylglucosamine-1-phosphate transferase|nr:undecaprenyl/decaprenyl-phosphate alpha-N-acetylglucosaminyl 1-phosphate transferase [Tannerellaceae bacterium]
MPVTQFWIVSICLLFVLCTVFAGILIPLILLVSFRKKLFDVPDGRKIHQDVIPRLGGAAFTPAVFLSMAMLLGLHLIRGREDILVEAGSDMPALSFGYCTVMALYLLGIADDLIGVRYRIKFAVQILCGIMLVAGGMEIQSLHGVLGIHALPAWTGYALTVLTVVFIINAVNLIDGIDGLASGLSGLALILYGLAFFALQKYIYAMLSFAMLGALVPFFCYNVFGNAKRGKKIFMGDTGSLTTGMVLCFLGIKLLLCAPDFCTVAFHPAVLAFSPLLIPCFDVVRLFVYRIRHGKSPFMPDKNHIHHKLLATGMSQRIAMLTILLASLVFTLCNVLLSHWVNVNLLLAGDALVWIAANMWLTRKMKQRNPNPAVDKLL